MATNTEVIDVGVADHGASNDGVRSVKHEMTVVHVYGSLAVIASNYVSEITVVTNLAVGATMDDLLGVPMRASSNASFDEVSVDVNVESVLARSESDHLSLKGDLLSFDLGEFDDTADAGATVGVKNANSRVYCGLFGLLFFDSLCLFSLDLIETTGRSSTRTDVFERWPHDERANCLGRDLRQLDVAA